LGDAWGGPQFGGEAELGGALAEPGEDDPLLLGGQLGRAAGLGLGIQPRVAVAAVVSDPLAYGAGVDAEEAGDFGLGVAFEDAGDGGSRVRWLIRKVS
jgi:hypothetical protein